jgi:hypothetical protein
MAITSSLRFTKFVGSMCAGRTAIQRVVQGLAKELGINVRYLEKLAEGLRKP